MKVKYLAVILLLAGCGNGYEEVVPGLKMKKIEQGQGKGMQNGTDYFYLNAHVYNEKDEPFSSPSFNPNFVYLAQIKEPAYAADFTQSIPGLKKGDSLSFETQADSLFPYYYGAEPPSELKGKNIHLHVKVVNILTEAEYYEKLEQAKEESKTKAYQEFEQFLKDNHITQEPIGRGTIKVTVTPGSGNDAFLGDVVSIHMVQKTLAGAEIENTRKMGAPFEYEIGNGNGLMGLDEALMKMKKGEKAMIYLPYFLAFGESGLPPKVAPYSNIMMEVELLEIRKPY